MFEDYHPDVVDLEAYCAALLDEEDEARIHLHVLYCSECSQTVEEIFRRIPTIFRRNLNIVVSE